MEQRVEKLLTVEDAFVIEGRGVMVAPWIPLAQYPEEATQLLVLLRKPDGSDSRLLATFTMPHVPHPDKLCFACLLTGVKKEDVPVGSEVFRFVEVGEGSPNQRVDPTSVNAPRDSGGFSED